MNKIDLSMNVERRVMAMKTYTRQQWYGFVCVATVALAAGAITAFADQWPELPTHQTYVFPTYFPKNGQGDYAGSGFSPGYVRERMSDFYEGWWRETSYYRADPTNGLKVRGYYMDTKTVGEIAQPWPWNPGQTANAESNIVGAVIGTAVAGITNVYKGTLNPVPVAGRSLTFRIGSRFLTDTGGGGQLGGDGVGTVNHSTGAYSFQLTVAAPEGTPIEAFYTCFLQGAGASPGAWANYTAVIGDLGLSRYPDGRGEQFDELPDPLTPSVIYRRWDSVNQVLIDDPLMDGFWTPGERFTDNPSADGLTPPNGRWDPYVHYEDRWTPHHGVTGIAQRVLSTGFRTFINNRDSQGNAIGDVFADYDFSCAATGTNVPPRITSFDGVRGMVSASVDIWIADTATGTNVMYTLSEFDLTPPSEYRNGVPYYGRDSFGSITADNSPRIMEGDAWHIYDRDNNAPPPNIRPTYGNVPVAPQVNGRFEYEIDANGVPFVYRSPYVISIKTYLVEDLIVQCLANPNVDVGGFIFQSNRIDVVNPSVDFLSTLVHQGTNAIIISHRVPAIVNVPVYYAVAVWGQPQDQANYQNPPSLDPYVPIDNIFIDAVGNDDKWTPAVPEEPYTDFISWWDPTATPPGFVPGLTGTPRGVLPPGALPTPLFWSYTRYCKYIRDNYPGDTNGLVRRCGDSKYDGPENFADTDNNQMMQVGVIGTSVSIGEGRSGWDFATVGRSVGVNNYADWWHSKFGTSSDPVGPGWLSIPNMVQWKPQLTDFNQTVPSTTTTNFGPTGMTVTVTFGAVIHPPPGTTWTYDSAREFYDIASSMYHNPDLNSLSATFMRDFAPIVYDVNPLSADYGGDFRLGEVTSPWNQSIFGQDRGDCDPTTADLAPSGTVPDAGPFAYNTHANYGYDAANILNIEVATWRTDGLSPTGPRGGSSKGAGYDWHPVVYVNWGNGIIYSKDHRDVNLNGMIDQGETIPAGSQNYYVDPIPTTVDNGMDTIPMFGWERYTEDCIDTFDVVENFYDATHFQLALTNQSDWGVSQPSGYTWQQGTPASGFLSNAVNAQIAFRDIDGSTNFTPGVDSLWVDSNGNMAYDGMEALIHDPTGAGVAVPGLGPATASWVDLDGVSGYNIGGDLVWRETYGSVGYFDSEPVLQDMTGFLAPGDGGPFGANDRSTNSIYVYISAGSTSLIWAVTNSYGGATDAFGGTNGVDLIYCAPGFTPTFWGSMTGRQWNVILDGGVIKYICRTANDPGYQAGDDVFIDTNGNGLYDGDTAVSVPLNRLLLSFNGLADSGTFNIGYTTNGVDALFHRATSVAWREQIAPGNTRNGEFVLFSSASVTNGMHASGYVTNIMWVDVTGPLGVPDGVYTPLQTLSDGGEGGTYTVGDAVFYDANRNGVFDFGASVAVPTYIVGLYNQTGVSAPGVFHSGNFYGSMTREGYIGGFNQVQPVALDMPVPSVLTHEQCHDVLGWPDLYDFDSYTTEVVNNPIANGDLMSIPGSLWHGYPDLKSVFGVVFQELNSGSQPILRRNGGQRTLLLYPVERYADQYYIFRDERNPSEYFTINFNAGTLAGTTNPNNEQPSPYANPIGRGIVIGHSDYTGVTAGRPQQQRSNNRFTWLYVQADGLYQLEDGTGVVSPPDAFGTTPTTRTFTANTRPPARWWDQSDSGLRILDIRLPTDPYAPAEVVIDWVTPLGSANGVGTDWYWVPSGVDSDGDGIPDDWEYYWFARYPNPLAECNGLTDHDGDGLSDRAEWLAHGNPMWQSSWVSTNYTALPVSDADIDLDGDGLSNLAEYRDHHTRPRDIDSDDDGIADGAELDRTILKPDGRWLTSPVYSRSPLVEKALRLAGSDRYLIPEESSILPYEASPITDFNRLRLTNWTVEAWIFLDSTQSCSVVTRDTLEGAQTFVLAVTNNRPFAAFKTVAGMVYRATAPDAIAISNWVHIAATFDSGADALKIYVDGALASSTTIVNNDPGHPGYIGGGIATGYTWIGGGLNGIVDEVRIWSRARTQSEIENGREKIINSPWRVFAPGTFNGSSMVNDGTLVVNLRFDDGQDLTNRLDYGMIAFGAEDWVHPTNWNYAVINTVSHPLLTAQFVTNCPRFILSDSILDPFDDLNEDSIPDWWQQLYWPDFDPFTPGAWDADNDPDSDGLSNYYEYILDTNPKSQDTSAGLAGRNDLDNDGLSDWDEVALYGTDPRNADSDDDGISDGQEILNFTNPLYSRSPQILRSMVMDGTRKYKMPEGMSTSSSRFSLGTWTIEFWVKLQNASTTGALISRGLTGPFNGLTNWAVIVSNNVPYTFFQTSAGRRVQAGGGLAIPAGQWVHLSSVFDPTRNTLELMVDDVAFTAQATLERPALGTGQAYVGDIGVVGLIDEIRVWNVARTQTEIVTFRDEFMPWSDSATLVQGQAQRVLVERIRSTPGQFQEFGGSIYEFISAPMSYTQAVAYAASLGGKLVSINSAAENAFVAGLASLSPTIWIGMNDAAVEGTWVGEDGRTTVQNNYSNWETWMQPGGAVTYSQANLTGPWNGTLNSAWDPSLQTLALTVDATGAVVGNWSGTGGSQPITGQLTLTDPNAGTVAGTITSAAGTVDEITLDITANLLGNTAPFGLGAVGTAGTVALTGGSGAAVGAAGTLATEPNGGVDENYAAMAPQAVPAQQIEAGGWFDRPEATVLPFVVEYGQTDIGGLMAWYVFDDGTTNTVKYGAEDFIHQLDWRFAIKNVIFTNDHAEVIGFEDLDQDGLPDWWERLWFGDLSPTAEGDPDADGLPNLQEYRLNTNPLDRDTNNNWISDGDEDADGDGLSNADEVRYGTDPLNPDSDDDGYSDGVELSNLLPVTPDNYGISRMITGPMDSMSPFIPRSFILGGHNLKAPHSERFAFPEMARVGGPVVTITAPLNNAQIPERFTTITGTVTSEWPIVSLQLFNNGDFVMNLGTATAFSETIIIRSGANELTVVAVDSEGLTGEAVVNVVGTFARADIRVTQTWTANGDLDTWLVDPLGRHMGWTAGGPGLPTNIAQRIPGSFLDIDDVSAMGPENITVEEGFATNGNYYAWMNNFANRNNAQSTVRVLVLEGRPGEKYVEFGPQPMPVSDGNGNNPQAWWNTTTISWPSGDMVPPGTPVGGDTNESSVADTGLGASKGWTAEAWIKTGNGNQTGAIASYRLLSGLEVFSVGLTNNRPFIRIRTSAYTNVLQVIADPIPSNEWTHLAFVYGESQKSLRIHVNGSLVISQTMLESRLKDMGVLYVDTYFGGNQANVFNNGHLDEVRFWSSARNGGLISARMHEAVAASSTLVAGYRFDDGGRGIEDIGYATNRLYDLALNTLPDVLINAAPGPDGIWGTGDDVAWAAGSDGHNDYVTAEDYAPVFGIRDADGDGMPDWFESIYGGTKGLDPFRDADGDGLNNLNEYKCGTNPLVEDSDGDGVLDGDEDADGDGVSNIVEQEFGSDPSLPDTDDDGVGDAEEIAYATDPADSLTPLKNRVLFVTGAQNSYVNAPHGARFVLTGFDISASVYPMSVPGAGALVVREVQTGVENYYLGIDAARRPVVRFTASDDGSSVQVLAPELRALPLNTWTHIRGIFDPSTNRLTLVINGEVVGTLNTSKRPARDGRGPVSTLVGRGIAGYVDNVMIKGSPETVLSYLFDDDTNVAGTSGMPNWHTGQVQDFAPGLETDWANHWLNAGTLVNATIVEPAAIGNGDTDGDGLPDVWELAHGLNPFSKDSDGDGVPDGLEDSDLDGLNNLYEYLAGLDPNDPDTGNTGTLDRDKDIDSDGLTNVQEQRLGTRPDLPDTDDDGVNDGAEVFGPVTTVPNSSLSPAVSRALLLSNATAYVSVPAVDVDPYSLTNGWTVEAWVSLDPQYAGPASIIRCGSSDATYFELGIDASRRPFVRRTGQVSGAYQEETALSPIALAYDNSWYHLAGVYSPRGTNADDRGELTVYVNGMQRMHVPAPAEVGQFSATGVVSRTIGGGLVGMIDEVRIWGEPRRQSDLVWSAYKTFEYVQGGGLTGLGVAQGVPVAYFRFDDGGTTAEDFAGPMDDWNTGWAHAGALVNGAVMVATNTPTRANESVDSDSDGLPDWWEMLYFGNLATQNRDGDPDGDGLNNGFEFLCGTSPVLDDTLGDNTMDSDRDSDGDGLTNAREFELGTMPNKADTDDDGLTDFEEVTGDDDLSTPAVPRGMSNPLWSLDPIMARALHLDGNGRVVVQPDPEPKLIQKEWTLEAWVYPSNNADGIIIRREASDEQGMRAVNFELGVKNVASVLYPYARYVGLENGLPVEVLVDGLAPHNITRGGLPAVGILAQTWTHLAATYNASNHEFKLYINAEPMIWREDAVAIPLAVSVGGETSIGGCLDASGNLVSGFEGYIDEVRVWNKTRSTNEIMDLYQGIAISATTGEPTQGKGYTELTPDEKTQVDTTLATAKTAATKDGSRYKVGYSPVLLRPLSQLCGLKKTEAPGETKPGNVMGTVRFGALPEKFNLLDQNGVTPIRDQGQCGSCWSFSTVGQMESAIKVADGIDTDLSEQYLVSCNNDGYSCNGGLWVHKYHFDTPSRDGLFGAVWESNCVYAAADLDCGGPYARPYKLDGWSYIGTGPLDMSVPTEAIKQAMFEHGAIGVAVFVGPAFQAYAGGVFNTSEGGGDYGNHAVILVGWDDTQNCWIMRNSWGVGWGENGGYMRIAYGCSGIGQGACYVIYNGAGPGPGPGPGPAPVGTDGLVMDLRFDDNGATAENFAFRRDWILDWRHAGKFEGDAATVAGVTPPNTRDSDLDGMPDWWELAMGLDPFSADGINGADGDPDGDGLRNLYEYLAGTNPFMVDSDLDGVSDYKADSDQDGVSNGNEQDLYHTDPGNWDTDDDGISDGAELTAGTDPANSLSPYVFRAIDFAGTMDSANTVVVADRINGQHTARLSLPTWTVEMAVRADVLGAGVYPLVSRRAEESGRLNYEVGLTNGYPYVRFDETEDGNPIWVVGGLPLIVGQWTHLAGRFDEGQLTLFVNGETVAARRVTSRSAQGYGDLTIGSPGFNGQLRDIRIWKVAQTDQQIKEFMNHNLLFGNVASLSGYLQVSGAGHLKENAVTLQPNGDPIDVLRENWTLECWVRTDTSGRLILRRNQSERTDDDFNYFLGITPEGSLIGRFAAEWEVWHYVLGFPELWYIQVDYNVNNIYGEILVNDGNWHHVAYVRDDVHCALYVDGMLDAVQERMLVTYPPVGWVENPQVRALVGPCIFGEDLTGNLDEIRIWNRGLPSGELATFDETGTVVGGVGSHNLTGTERGLISYFNFDFQLRTVADERAAVRDPETEYGIYIRDATNIMGVADGPPISYDPLLTFQRVALSALFTGDDGGQTLEDLTFKLGLEPFNFEQYAGRMGASVSFVTLAPADWPYTPDSDNDGLTDMWEVQYGLDTGKASGEDGPDGDPDGDGLSNLYEFLAGTNPRSPDSDGDGIPDYKEDSDHDGLSNGDEQDVFGTNPGLADTDDDGINDGAEVDPSVLKNGRRITSPVYSRSPTIQRSMQLTGAPVLIPDPVHMGENGRFNLSSWAIECRVRPTAAQTGSLIERVTRLGQTNFALRLVANVPYVEYTTSTGTRLFAGGLPAIPANEWTYLAGVFDPENNELALYVNGVIYRAQETLQSCALGAGTVTLGGTVNGYIDQVRIWDGPLSFEQVQASTYDFGWGAAGDPETGALLWYKFPKEDIPSIGTNNVTNVLSAVVSTVTDATANHLNGAVTAGIYTNVLKDNFGIALAGDGYVDTPVDGRISLARVSGLTVGLWWNADTLARDRMTLLSKRSEGNLQRGLCLSVVSGGVYRLELELDHWVEFKAPVSAGKWYQVVLTKNGSDWRLYHNGAELHSTASAGWPYAVDADVPASLRLGNDHVDTTAGFVGILDELAVYRYGMSSEGASGLYASGRNATGFNVSKMVAWFPFDDGGVTAEDYAHQLDWDYAISGVTMTNLQFANLYGDIDTDGDGMPDWWEKLKFGKVNAEPDLDPDADGLNNLYEYYADTNPLARDTDNDAIPDGSEDADSDGLTNAEEQRAGTHPLLPDTDDDGINDAADKGTGGDPASSIMRLTPRALNLGGAGYVEMPLDTRFALESWTLEAWINPTAGGGTIIERSVSATDRTFRLRLVGNAPTIDFNGTTLTGPTIPVSGSEWTHVAVTYDSDQKVLSMYYADFVFGTTNPIITTNAVTNMAVTTAPSPYGVGPITQRIGEGFRGWVEEVRIWDRALSAQTVADNVPVWLEGEEEGLVAYYRFDDSTAAGGVSGEPTWTRGQVEDFTWRYRQDWWHQWRHAATLVGTTSFQTLDSFSSPIPIPLDSDGDGLPDWFEDMYSGCLDKNNPDTDGNGISDYFDDQDGDGVSNYDEYRLGTDPCHREVLTATPPSPYDIQVGDTKRIVLTRPAWSTNVAFTAICYVSDPSLLSLIGGGEAPGAAGGLTITFPVGVATQTINITAMALAEGLPVQVGTIQIVGEDWSVLTLTVQVHPGNALELVMDPPNQSVAVGDTTTFKVTRNMSIYGMTNMPAILTTISSDPDRLAAPETVVIPAGLESVHFQVTGRCPATNGVYLSVEAPGYPGTNLLLRVEPPRYLTIAEAITPAGDNGLNTANPASVLLRPDEVRYLIAYRPHDQQGADLVLNMESSDPTIFAVAPAVLTIPAGQQGAQFTVTGVAGGTNLVFARACGQTVASAMIGVAAAITLSGPAQVVMGDIETFTMDLDVAAGNTSNIVVQLDTADANSMAAIQFLDPSTLKPITSVTVSGGLSRITFAVEGLKVYSPVNITTFAPGWAFTPGNLTISVVPPTLVFDQAVYDVEISNYWPFALSRGVDEAAGSLTVSLTSSSNDVFTVPGSVTFAPGETTVGGLIHGGNGGGAVSNALLTAEVAQVSGSDLPIDTAQVNLHPKVTRLIKMRWYDTDANGSYSLGDKLELIFNTVMSNQTVLATNLHFMATNTLGVWHDTGLGASYFLGTGYSALTVSNSSIYAYSNSHFFVTLGSSPHAYYTFGVDPSNAVLAANGDPDMTFPPVRFPKYAAGEDGDGDGLPSEWEEDNGLDPDDPYGDNGFYGDPDRDGLINGYEFLATKVFAPETMSLLNPRSFDSNGNGVGDYDDRFARCQLTYGEMFDDADLLPDWWEAENQIVADGWATTLSTTTFGAFEDEDGDGWVNLDEFLYQGETNGVPFRGTDPSDAASYPEPKIGGILTYEGAAPGDFHVVAYGSPTMDGLVLAEATVSNVGRTVQFELTGLKSGDIYLFAYKGGEMFSEGNPWGIPDQNPIKVTWSGAERVTIGLNDTTDRPYYPSFSWPATTGVPKYYVRVYSGTVLILTKWVTAPRTWFTYRDYQTATYTTNNSFYGLPPGTYQYQVAANDVTGVFIVNKTTFVVSSGTVTTPRLIEPVGASVVQHTIVDFTVSNAQPVAALSITVSNLASHAAASFTNIPPWHSADGLYKVRLPIMFGDGAFTNGQYSWTCKAFNGTTWTTNSSPQTFILDIGSDSRAAPTLGGKVLYFGRVPTNLVVEAFLTAGFSGSPVARYTRTSPSSSNGFVLQGLQHAVYYVRAYFDANTNRTPEVWESQAFARDPSYGEHFEFWDNYGIGAFDLTDRQSLSNVVIVIRDRDTDADRMPDAWEVKYFGSLGRDGGDDFDNDGLTDLQEYACGSNPKVADTDGDGLTDAQEMARGTDPANRDTDGDGLSDSAEVSAGTNPLNPDTDGDGIPDGIDPSPKTKALDSTLPGWIKIAWDGNSGTYNPYVRASNPGGRDLNADKADTDGDGISDLEEIAAGSDPINPASSNTVKIASWSMAGGQMRVEWDVYGNRLGVPVTFHVEATVDMTHWIEVGVYTSDGVTPQTVVFEHSPLGLSIIGYRLRVTIE